MNWLIFVALVKLLLLGQLGKNLHSLIKCSKVLNNASLVIVRTDIPCK